MSDLSNEERETHLNQSAADRKTWEMATDDPVWIARMERLGIAPDRTRGATHFYTLKDEQVVVRKGKRHMSEAQRAASVERMREMRRKQSEQGEAVG